MYILCVLNSLPEHHLEWCVQCATQARCPFTCYQFSKLVNVSHTVFCRLSKTDCKKLKTPVQKKPAKSKQHSRIRDIIATPGVLGLSDRTLPCYLVP